MIYLSHSETDYLRYTDANLVACQMAVHTGVSSLLKVDVQHCEGYTYVVIILSK
jgi:hypothetical protein